MTTIPTETMKAAYWNEWQQTQDHWLALSAALGAGTVAQEPVGYASDYGLEKLASKAHWYCLSVSKAKENEYVHPLYATPQPAAVAVPESPTMPTPPLPREDDAAWKQVLEMFATHGEIKPSWQLRDKLVGILVWAQYGHAVSVALTAAPSPASEPAPKVVELRDAIKNLLGVYDTPLSRRRFPQDEFMREAIETARSALSSQEGSE